jgi:hypothetical protein
MPEIPDGRLAAGRDARPSPTREAKVSAYTHPVSRAIPDAVRQLASLAGVCTVAFLEHVRVRGIVGRRRRGREEGGG